MGLRRVIGRSLKVVGAALAALVLLVVAIVGVSWFFLEPPSEDPDPSNESKATAGIIDVLTGKLEKQYAGGHFLRDTHAKAAACVKANFTLAPGIQQNLSVGVFKGKPNGERTYKAWIRFSNADDRVKPDTEPDFRGIAMKLFGVDGERLPFPGDERNTQDFLLIGHDTFFAGNPQHFHDFFAGCVKGGGVCDPMKNPHVAWHFLTHPRGALNGLVGRKVYPSIANIRWFSVSPYRLGDNQIVKYGAFACEQPTDYSTPGTSDDYLMQRLKDQLDPAAKRSLCLNFMVQIRADPRTEPIENVLVPWSHEVSPWHKVATIDIYPQAFASGAQTAFCDRLTFNPWHGLTVHTPLGGINRARRNVMHGLQDVRLKANGLTRFGPSELTGDEVFN